MKKIFSKLQETVITRIVVTFIIVILILGCVIIASSSVYNKLVYSMFNDMTAISTNTFHMYIDSVDETCSGVAAVISADHTFQDGFMNRDPAVLQKEFSDINCPDEIHTATFLDTKGVVLYSTSEESKPGDDISWRVHVQNAMKGSALGSYVEDFEGVEVGYAVGYPIIDEGNLIGIVSFTVNISDSELLNSIKKRTGNEYTVVHGGVRVASTIPSVIGQQMDPTILANLEGTREEYNTKLNINDAYYSVKYSPIEKENGEFIGALFCGVNIETANRELNGITIICVSLALILGVISVIISTVVAEKHIRKPLYSFTKIIAVLETFDIRANNKLMKFDTSSKNELGVLARGLKEMADSLMDVCDEITRVLSAIADGDLTVKLNNGIFKGDLKEVEEAVEKILTSFNVSMDKINISAGEVASGAEEVSSGAQALSQGATEQASEIEQLSNIVKDITSKISQNARYATEANEITANTHQISLESQDSMNKLSNAMVEINDVTLRMEKVVKTIDDFAFQTNILALNAAVEAARAGVHGRGFAVVAEEVRSLASKSAEAAKETGDLIGTTVQIVESGVMLAQETNESFEKVVGLIDDVTERVENIADASNDQATSAAHIVTSIDEITKVIQTNSATAEESAAASEELSSLSNVFKEIVNQFKLDRSIAARSHSSTSLDSGTGSSVPETYAAQESSSSFSDGDDKYF